MIKHLVAAMILVVTGMIVAQNAGVPGYYLTLFPSAKAMGQGGGSAAIVDNSDALYWNPAGLGFARTMELGASFAKLGTGLNYYPAAYCAPLGSYGTVGVSYVGALSPDAPEIDEFGIDRGGRYNAGNNSVSLSYGKSVSQRASFGASIRIASANVGNASGMGVGFDLGAIVRPVQWLSLGASLYNILGPTIRLGLVDERYTTTFTGAIGVFPLAPFFTSERLRSLAITLDGQVLDLLVDKAEFTNEKVTYAKLWRAGLVFDPLPFVELRTGVNNRTVNGGFGIMVKNIGVDYGIGYHYGLGNYGLGFTHAIGMRYSIGRPLSKQEEDVLHKEKEVLANDALASARERYIEGDYGTAKEMVEKYLLVFPKNIEALKFLSGINQQLSVGTVGILLKKSREALDKSDIASATQFVNQALVVSPANSEAITLKNILYVKSEVSQRIKKIRTLYEENKYEEVSRELDAINSLDSGNAHAQEYRLKIASFLQNRDADRFVANATKLYYDGHQVEKANNELQKALALSPDHADAKALYEKISKEIKEVYLKKVGQMVDGQKLSVDNQNLKKLMQLDAQDKIVRIRSLVDNKQYDQALADVMGVLRDAPQDSVAAKLKNKIDGLMQQQKAELAYSEALKLYNDNDMQSAEVKIAVAVALDSTNEKARILKVDISKKQKVVTIAQARQFLVDGKKEKLYEAQKLVAEFLAVDPENEDARALSKNIETEIFVVLANDEIDSGNYEKADTILQNALRLSPDNKKVQAAFKNLKEAMEALK